MGRVQTPTLALIVERQQAIEAFQAEPYFQLEGRFGTLRALWHRGNVNRLAQKEQALKLQQKLTGSNGTVTKLDTSRKTEDRPLLFDLTELQRESNRRFGYTAQETLSIAQSLYEKHKLITYPRTDSRYLTADMKPLIPQLLRENNVLKLIMVRMIAALSGKKIFEETKLEITMDNQKDTFKATGRIMVDEGWTLVERTLLAKPAAQQEDGKAGEQQEEEQILTGIALHQPVHLNNMAILEKKTTPPKPYTEATLLTAMEKASREIDDKSLKESMKGKGLGTPATRAGIIEKLITVGYVERRKKSLYPTQQGITFIQLAPESIRQVEMTAQWELELQEICDGKGNPARFMEEIRQYVQQIVLDNQSLTQVQAVSRKGMLRRVVGKCPKCGCNVIESDKSFYCDGFRQALLATGKMQVNDLVSKAGNHYNAIFYMEPGEQYVNFRMEFAPRTPTPAAPTENQAQANYRSSEVKEHPKP